jgi:excisionase family DNA binding protein
MFAAWRTRQPPNASIRGGFGSAVKKYVRPKEACERWGIGKTRLYELLNAGLIAAHRLGPRLTLIDVEDGDRFFASLPLFTK